MAAERDVQAFHERAATYEAGWRGQLHHDIVSRSLELALVSGPVPGHVLDVGCGTGLLLRLLAPRLPGATALVGLDAAAGMVEEAMRRADDPRLSFVLGVAERLPYPDDSFDLVVSTTSFDHWEDQAAGLAECARVLGPGGRLVLTDLFSLLLVPVTWGSRRDRARTRRRAGRLLRAAGFRSVQWRGRFSLIIGSVVATGPF